VEAVQLTAPTLIGGVKGARPHAAVGARSTSRGSPPRGALDVSRADPAEAVDSGSGRSSPSPGGRDRTDPSERSCARRRCTARSVLPGANACSRERSDQLASRYASSSAVQGIPRRAARSDVSAWSRRRRARRSARPASRALTDRPASPAGPRFRCRARPLSRCARPCQRATSRARTHPGCRRGRVGPQGSGWPHAGHGRHSIRQHQPPAWRLRQAVTVVSGRPSRARAARFSPAPTPAISARSSGARRAMCPPQTRHRRRVARQASVVARRGAATRRRSRSRSRWRASVGRTPRPRAPRAPSRWPCSRAPAACARAGRRRRRSRSRTRSPRCRRPG